MNDIIKKKLITESIQGWFVLDNILFGGYPDVCLKENSEVLNKYNLLKKKFLKTTYEFYNVIGYKSGFSSIPKNHGEIEHRALCIYESLKHDLTNQFNKNRKAYCKIISEGVDYNNDKLLKKRTNYLGRSLMIENFFINKPLSLKTRQIPKEQITIYKNCLTEVAQKLLDISSKYFKNF